MYDKERLLIVPGTSEYFVIPTGSHVEISGYGQ